RRQHEGIRIASVIERERQPFHRRRFVVERDQASPLLVVEGVDQHVGAECHAPKGHRRRAWGGVVNRIHVSPAARALPVKFSAWCPVPPRSGPMLMSFGRRTSRKSVSDGSIAGWKAIASRLFTVGPISVIVPL